MFRDRETLCRRAGVVPGHWLETHPEDARVWYLAAIANGLSHGRNGLARPRSWSRKGVDRERPGRPPPPRSTPPSPTLTKETGKDWLAYYRRQAGR